MGEVYRARDTRIGRDVAVKVLPASLAAEDQRSRRFEQEVRAAGRLNHPNVLTLYDVGTHEGAGYLVTELLEGETLRGRLSREGLPWRKTVELSVQIARGLSAAHERGIVHRDLKPENLFVTRDGIVKILDFGLAKLRPALDDEALEKETASQITAPGTVLGTLGYMAPEQVEGQRADARSDIFSLGCVLYEMISGRQAFRGDTAAETLGAILKDDPPELGTGAGTVPPALERVVRRCLEKRPEERFQSARDLAFALEALSDSGSVDARTTAAPAPARRWMRGALAAGVLAVVVAGAILAWRRGAAPPASRAPAGTKLLAVLPFENLGTPEDEYFADGMTDEVRGKLAALPGLRVVARTSSNQYKRTTKPAAQIASELGVQYLLTATVRWEKHKGGESRVRVSPELVEAATATTSWQQPFDAVLSDVFEVQADIAGQVARALDLALGQGERQRLGEKPTSNLAAYEAYLQGTVAAGGFVADRLSMRRAIGHYEQAVALDPVFALAWAHLSRAHSFMYEQGVPTPADREGARVAAERALALAPGLPAGHVAQGQYYNSVLRDWPRALEHYAQGRQMAPHDPDLLVASAFAQQHAGRWDEALASLREAQELDPRSARAALNLSFHLMLRRRYAEALAAADRGLALAPQSMDMRINKVTVLLAQGDLAGAQAVIKAAPREVAPTALVAHVATYGDYFWVLDDEQQRLLLRLTPGPFDDDPMSWGLALAQTAALRGDAAKTREYAEAARAAAEAQLRETPDALRHTLLGLTLAYLGRYAEAVREGERAVALEPLATDAVRAPYLQHQLARIYIRAGETERALDILERLLQVPCELSPGRLRIDPDFAPLKDHPRFKRLVSGT